MLVKLAQKYVRRAREIYSNVLELPDSPRKIALGVALGTALDFLPVPLISIPISFVLAKLIRVNAAAAVLAVIFFKWAVPFFFAFNYYIGKAILGGEVRRAAVRPESLISIDAWVEWIIQLGYPFILGAAVNSVAAAAITYFIIKALLDCHRKKKRNTLPVKFSRPKEIR